MPRIAPLALATAPEAVKQLLAADRPNPIALLFGHAETNWPRLADLLLSILSQQALDPRVRELDLESDGPIDPDFARAVNRGGVGRVPSGAGQ